MLFTIGFAGRSAETFFETLRGSGVTRVVDIRRSNTSQLAGFTKKSDLSYFLENISGTAYVHLPELSPEAELFRSFRSGEIDWDEFVGRFQDQLSREGAIERATELEFDGSCLLCACSEATQCHRRIVAELLSAQNPSLQVRHL